MEAVEGELFGLRREQLCLAPADEAQVVEGGADLQAFHHLVDGPQVDTQTKAADAGTVDIGLAEVYMHVGTAVLVVLVGGILKGESLHVDLTLGLAAGQRPGVACQVGGHALHFQIGTGYAEKCLQLGTYAQLLVDVARVAEGYFNIRLATRAEIVEGVALVAHVLGKGQQVVGQRHVDGGLAVHLEGVIATHAFEAERDDGHGNVGLNAVHTRAEAFQRLVGGNAGVHEREVVLARLGVLEQHVAQSKVALRTDIEVAYDGDGDVVLLVAVGGVHVVAELVVVGEIGRAQFLGHRRACHSCQHSCYDISLE